MELPADWRPSHSLAVVLVGAATVDLAYAVEERADVVAQLAGLFAEDAGTVLAEAEAWLQQHAIDGGPGAWSAAVLDHARLLVSDLDPDELSAALQAIRSVVEADGTLDDREQALWQQIAAVWGLDVSP